MIKVLGLDISTTTIGISIIECDGYGLKLLHNSYFKPPKDAGIFEMLDLSKKHILGIIKQFSPTDIAIEEYVQFMKGRSGAKTIIPLAVLNRTIGLACFEIGIKPKLFNVMSIRHAIKRNKKLPAKEDIPELVAEILDIEFPYIKNKKGKNIKENSDMADSIAVALAFLKKVFPNLFLNSQDKKKKGKLHEVE